MPASVLSMSMTTVGLLAVALGFAVWSSGAEGATIRLPSPKLDSEVSVEAAIARRRSVRRYANAPLTLAEVSQLLWAAQGVTEPREQFRAAPSAGATYPLETFLVAGKVTGLESGVYRYVPRDHALRKTIADDVRGRLEHASWGQGMVLEAPASIVLTAIYRRTTQRYRDRGIRYVHIEIGHVGQNIYLQAESLGLATVAIGAFDDDEVRKALRLRKEEPLYIMPVGRPMSKGAVGQ